MRLALPRQPRSSYGVSGLACLSPTRDTYPCLGYRTVLLSSAYSSLPLVLLPVSHHGAHPTAADDMRSEIRRASSIPSNTWLKGFTYRRRSLMYVCVSTLILSAAIAPPHARRTHRKSPHRAWPGQHKRQAADGRAPRESRGAWRTTSQWPTTGTAGPRGGRDLSGQQATPGPQGHHLVLPGHNLIRRRRASVCVLGSSTRHSPRVTLKR